MKSKHAKMKSMDNHIQKGIATSFKTHHNPFSYCRFSPDCQAFVHDVGSTDSVRIKDILWLYKIPLFKSTTCQWIQGRNLNSSLRIQFLTMPAHRAIFKLCFAYCSYIILCSNNSLNYKFAITLKYLRSITEVSYRTFPFLLFQPIQHTSH